MIEKILFFRNPYIARRRTPKGFTFPELMLAICFISLAVVGLLALFTNCMLMTEKARNLTVAAAHAGYVLEEIRNSSLANVNNTNWTTWSQNAGLNNLNQELVTVVPSGTDPLTVSLTVSWADRFGNQSLNFVTKLTQ